MQDPDLVKLLLGKGGKTDFLVRQWGIRRTRKSVLPLNQQAVTYRVMIGSFLSADRLMPLELPLEVEPTVREPFLIWERS